MKKTRQEWIDELVLMSETPNPDTPEKAARADEMWSRVVEISEYLSGHGPEPDPDWKPEHPPKDEAERQRDIEEYVERTTKYWLEGGIGGGKVE